MKKMMITLFAVTMILSTNVMTVSATSAVVSPQNTPVPEIITETEEVVITPVEETGILGEIAPSSGVLGARADQGVLGARADQGVLGARAPQTSDISLSLLLSLGVAVCAMGCILTITVPAKHYHKMNR